MAAKLNTVEYFSRCLSAFQSVPSTSYRVLCTLPHTGAGPSPRPWLASPQHRRGTDGIANELHGDDAASARKQQRRRLIVLDSSFNPPTKAHAAMALSAVEAALREPGASASRLRLVLLLAVNNADKAPRPAGFAQRLGMMEVFGEGLLEKLDAVAQHGSGGDQDHKYNKGQAEMGDKTGVEIDLAVTTMPYFPDKAAAMADSGFYGPTQQGNDGAPEQTFLVGFDTLVRVLDPKYYQSDTEGGETGMKRALGPFFSRAKLRVTMRPSESWGSVQEQEAYGRRLEGDAGWARERVELVEALAAAAEADEDDAVSSSRVRELVKEGGRLVEVEGLVGREVRALIERDGLYLER